MAKKTTTGVSLLVDQTPPGYAEWLAELKAEIRRAQARALVAVNAEMTMVYWRIGRDIIERQDQQGWGTKVIDHLSVDLRKEFDDADGFAPRSLRYMRKFAATWPEAWLEPGGADPPDRHQAS